MRASSRARPMGAAGPRRPGRSQKNDEQTKGCRPLLAAVVVTAPSGAASWKRGRAEASAGVCPTAGGQPLERTQGDFAMKTEKTFVPRTWSQILAKVRWGRVVLALAMLSSLGARADESSLVLPDLSRVSVLGGISGRSILTWGLLICVFGLLFGLVQYMKLKKLPVHRAMLEISELIYATCKTYLVTQGKFILILEVFIGIIMVVYFGVLRALPAGTVAVILLFSLIGIGGSYGVAWFGIRVNTFANSRTAFASLRGKPFPAYAIPLRAGMSIGMMLISTELLLMLVILLFVPGQL